MDSRITIGIIGYGNMGSAIAEGIKTKYEVLVFDKDTNKTKNLTGINVCKSIIELMSEASAVILAVKPQDFDTVLNEIKNFAQEKLIISIAAGITTEYIEKYLGKVKVIRAMPNIGAKIGESVTCLCKGTDAGDGDLTLAKELFDYIGKTLEIEENMMNTATAISGSGPAYLCDFLEAGVVDYKDFANKFEDAAQGLGFSDKDLDFLVNTTITSTVDLMKKGNLTPAELKKQVASKGGTTEAALEVLHRGGTLSEAIRAAIKRAKELAKTSPNHKR